MVDCFSCACRPCQSRPIGRPKTAKDDIPPAFYRHYKGYSFLCEAVYDGPPEAFLEAAEEANLAVL